MYLLQVNKAGYTAIPVADRWAGAEMRVFTLSNSITMTNGQTDGQSLLKSCVSATKKKKMRNEKKKRKKTKKQTERTRKTGRERKGLGEGRKMEIMKERKQWKEKKRERKT